MNDIWKSKKVIVTGGAGFIGSNMVKRLRKFGADVIVIDNLWRGKLENLLGDNGKSVLSKTDSFILADLTDEAKCNQFLRDADIVFHLADVVGGIDFVFSNEHYVYNTNILINTNVIKACVINSIKNYVYVGTACSYPKYLQMNNTITALSEEQAYPAEPESSYGWSKLMGEYEAELVQRTSNINVGILRLHNVYGPGVDYNEARSQVIPSLIRKAINYDDRDFVVWGSGNQYRDFVYIDDVVDALLISFEKGMNEGVIQIGTGQATTIKDLVDKITAISNKAIIPKYDLAMPEGDKGRVAVITKANEVLSWVPKVSIEKGIEKTYRWIESQMKMHNEINSCR